MLKTNKFSITIGEHLIYQNLPEDILSRINKLISLETLQKHPLPIYPSKFGRKA